MTESPRLWSKPSKKKWPSWLHWSMRTLPMSFASEKALMTNKTALNQRTLSSLSWSSLIKESSSISFLKLESSQRKPPDTFSKSWSMQSFISTILPESATEIWNQKISCWTANSTQKLLISVFLSHLLVTRVTVNWTHTKELLATCLQSNMPKRLTPVSRLICLPWLSFSSWWSPNASHLIKLKSMTNTTDWLPVTSLNTSGRHSVKLLQSAKSWKTWLLECSSWIQTLDLHSMKF